MTVRPLGGTLFVFVGIEPGEDEEGALGGVDAPSRHQLVAVLDDAPRCNKLFEHDRGKRHSALSSSRTAYIDPGYLKLAAYFLNLRLMI